MLGAREKVKGRSKGKVHEETETINHHTEIPRGTAALSERLGLAPAFSGRDGPRTGRSCPRRRRSGSQTAQGLCRHLSGTLNLTTWPNYFSQENYDNFTKQTGVPINVAVFGSNEEMLAKLQAGWYRLGRVRADQLHDLDLQGPRSSSNRSISN